MSEEDKQASGSGAEEMEDTYNVSNEVAADGDLSSQPDWSTLTVAALRAALVERGLMTTGRKADLVARLSAANDSTSPEQTEEVMPAASEETENQPCESVVEPTVVEASEKLADDLPEAEAEDEGPEVDEFVEWNEDPEHEHDGLIKVSEEAGADAETVKVVEVVDEVKEDDKKPPGKDDEPVEEGDIKTEEQIDMAVDVHRDRDLFYLTWHSKKITVPFKDEIYKDLEIYNRLQTVILYPISTADLYNDVVRKYTELAASIHVELDDVLPGKPPKGYLKLKFNSVDDARNGLEELKTLKEGITVRHFNKDDSEGHIMTTLKKEEGDERRGPTLFRLMYVGNLPADVTEATLREVFPDALQVIIPCNEETSERLGYAYIEYTTEKTVYDMCEKYKDAEVNGEKLYVIHAISEKKEKFGLLRDSLRRYWCEQINKFQRVIDGPYSRQKWEVADAHQKIAVLKRRLEKDRRRREQLRLPCPNYETAKDESGHSEKSPEERQRSIQREDRTSRDRHSSSHRDRRSSSTRSPRRTPPRRDYNRPVHSGSGSGRNVSSYPPREDVANKLVNQLQGLVSALTKLPAVEPPRPLLDNLHFAGMSSGYFDDRRQMGGSRGSYGSSYRGSSNYSSSYDNQGSSRYSSTKRYSDDSYGPEKKRRTSDYGNQGSSGSRYSGGGGGPSYNDDRYSGRRSDSSGGRQYNRSKF